MSEIVKGYKITDKDMKCNGFQYKLGEWVQLADAVPIIMCRHGLHFCTDAADCSDYYKHENGNRVFEVEASTDILKSSEDSKCAARAVRLVRELTWTEYYRLTNTGTDNQGVRNTGKQNTGDGNTGDNNSGHFNVGAMNRGSFNVGNGNQGDYNTGAVNKGSANTGDNNEGRQNTGSNNMGSLNSGKGNKGESNSGSHNLGTANTGSNNIGSGNSGDFNYGCNNTGRWNVGNGCVGMLNTKPPKFRIFDQETDVDPATVVVPAFFTCVGPGWADDVTCRHAEKPPADDPMHWHKAVREGKKNLVCPWPYQLMQLKQIPNFSFEAFEHVTGVSREELESNPPHKLDVMPKGDIRYNVNEFVNGLLDVCGQDKRLAILFKERPEDKQVSQFKLYDALENLVGDALANGYVVRARWDDTVIGGVLYLEKLPARDGWLDGLPASDLETYARTLLGAPVRFVFVHPAARGQHVLHDLLGYTWLQLSGHPVDKSRLADADDMDKPLDYTDWEPSRWISFRAVEAVGCPNICPVADAHPVSFEMFKPEDE